MDGAPSPPMAQSRTVERTNIPALVPERLTDLNYDVFSELADFQHRGERVDVDRLISYLGAAIENTAIMRGDRSEPTALYEHEAVNIAIDALRSKYPAWFGDEQAVASLTVPVADSHLSKGELKEAYFGDQIDPDTESVAGDDWTAHKRVILPLLALVLTRVREQIDADNEAATNSAQQTIKRTILREAIQHDLDEAEVGVAVDAAVQTLDERS